MPVAKSFRLLAVTCSLSGCTWISKGPTTPPLAMDRPIACAEAPEAADSLPTGSPDSLDLNCPALADLTRWVEGHQDLRIYSLLISRRGKLAYELYTSSIDRQAAHYLMSVTKSVTSALVGAAVGRGLLAGGAQHLTDVLPPGALSSEAQRRFKNLTLKNIMGMSALDAELPPHNLTPEAAGRGQAFWASSNRLTFALAQKLLPSPGTSFQYNDITPTLAAAMVQYASGKSLFDFGSEVLFTPLGFRNAEWMHQDAAGFDLGAYGLRLRPVDMQKFGILYLQQGQWQGRQVLPASWIATSFSPYIRSISSMPHLNYGWYWWDYEFGPGWSTHLANGWRGQRIAVIPDQDVVVTMTADLQGVDEEQVFNQIVRSWVMPAVKRGAVAPAPNSVPVAQLLTEVLHGPSRIPANAEPRMVPGVAAKDGRRPF